MDKKTCKHGLWDCEDIPGGLTRQQCRLCGVTKETVNPYRVGSPSPAPRASGRPPPPPQPRREDIIPRGGYRYQGDPMPHEKVTRNASVVRMHKLRPDMTFEALGTRYNITKQRAQQIVASAEKKEGRNG